MAIDVRSTRAWRKLRDQVVTEEPRCQLQLPGCAGASETADHIKPYATHPELGMARDNHRGACRPCNRLRSSVPDEALRLGGAAQPRVLGIFRPLT